MTGMDEVPQLPQLHQVLQCCGCLVDTLVFFVHDNAKECFIQRNLKLQPASIQ